MFLDQIYRKRLARVGQYRVRPVRAALSEEPLASPRAFFGQTLHAGAPYLVKIANPARAAAICALENEIGVHGRLRQHSSIVSLRDAGTQRISYLTGDSVDVPYAVYPFSESDLHDLTDGLEITLPSAWRRSLLSTLAQGLLHLWGHGLAHRDIKPDNILITRHPQPVSFKIADLGSACELEVDDIEKPFFNEFTLPVFGRAAAHDLFSVASFVHRLYFRNSITDHLLRPARSPVFRAGIRKQVANKMAVLRDEMVCLALSAASTVAMRGTLERLSASAQQMDIHRTPHDEYLEAVLGAPGVMCAQRGTVGDRSKPRWLVARPKRSRQLPLYGWKLHIGVSASSAVGVVHALHPLLSNGWASVKFAEGLDNIVAFDTGALGDVMRGRSLTIYPRSDGALRKCVCMLRPLLSGKEEMGHLPVSDFVVKGCHAIGLRYGGLRFDASPKIERSDLHQHSVRFLDDRSRPYAPEWARFPVAVEE